MCRLEFTRIKGRPSSHRSWQSCVLSMEWGRVELPHTTRKGTDNVKGSIVPYMTCYEPYHQHWRGSGTHIYQNWSTRIMPHHTALPTWALSLWCLGAIPNCPSTFCLVDIRRTMIGWLHMQEFWKMHTEKQGRESSERRSRGKNDTIPTRLPPHYVSENRCCYACMLSEDVTKSPTSGTLLPTK